MLDTKLRILVAEDDAFIARDIKNILETSGYEVVSIADNAKDVVKLAHHKKPDLILMDIMLKGKMNGIDAAEQINQEQNTPIIFLSALCDDETFLNAHSTKPYAYITKPFRKTDLLSKIGKVFKTAQ